MTARACGLIEWCQQAATLRCVRDAIVGADLIDGNGTLYDRPENSRKYGNLSWGGWLMSVATRAPDGERERC
jgi:hypothetical protein